MKRDRAAREGLAALRRERLPFAVLGALLLSIQLFLAGLSGAAMAAPDHGRAGDALCIGGEAGAAAPDKADQHHPECPCLAGSCVQTGPLAAPDGPAGAGLMRAPAAEAAATRPTACEGPDRRPLSLFARAGRGPPIPS